MPYLIPESPHHTRYEVKKSQFIGYAAPASSREQAMDFLAALRQQYPDARHHCWAYLLGAPAAPVSVAMNDDGEPSGTAGKPILNVLQHNNVGDVVIVVVRYFGGIKLGAGGLVRAYSAAAQMTLESLPTRPLVKQSTLKVETDFRHEQFVRHYVEQHQGDILQTHYQQHVVIELSLPDESIDELFSLAGSMGFTVRAD